MSDRFLTWLSAGAVTAGVSMAMLAGAAVASADDAQAADAGKKSTSESSNPVGKKQKSDKDASKHDSKNGDEKDESAGDAQSTDAASPATADEDTPSAKDTTSKETKKGSDRKTRKADTRLDKPVTASQPEDTTVAKYNGVDIAAVETAAVDVPARPQKVTAQAQTDETGPVDVAVAAAKAKQAPVEAALAFAAPAIPPARPTLINVVGSFFFSIFQAVEDFIAGPPAVPPGSTVRVQRSTLEIDCGPGYTVKSDWYFPDTQDPPTRLIYLQHGFPGSAAEYDYTAAELAERNNAIVVAPTIPGNLFDCYGCQLGGDPMHAAVAKLFLDDRQALLASAKAAGFEGDALPQRFVIMGHSGGGQLAGGAAGYFEEFAPDDQDHNLAGVILLDSSPIGGAIARAMTKIPEDIPVYTISAAPSFLNSQGGVNRVLTQARPGEFVGVELVNGVHADSFRSHNPLVQFFGSVAGLGFPRPENVQAVQVIAESWIDDWYDGTDTGIDGPLGSTIDIPGTDGARAYVLPAPAHQWTLVDLFVDALLRQVPSFDPCAVDPSATFTAASTCSAAPQTRI